MIQLLSATGLVRPVRRRGFCPACRGWNPEPGAQEVAPPALLAAGALGIAAVGWVILAAQARSMGGMSMGLGPLPLFAATWTAMLAAMMLPTAAPLIFEFARGVERRPGWIGGTGLLGGTYLAVWLLFGVFCFVAYDALRMPWPQQSLVGGAALVMAALYALTPWKHASEARCRELCALHAPLPFGLRRSAALVGLRYGLSCIGCTGALMVAMVLIGMASFGWMLVIAAAVVIYKLAPAPSRTQRFALSMALVALGVVYTVL